MFDRRTVARRGGRALIGVVGISATALSVIAAVMLPLPRVETAAPATTVFPQPEKQGLVCPGPLLELAQNESAATSVSAFGSAKKVFGSDSSGKDSHKGSAPTPKSIIPLDRAGDAPSGDRAPAVVSIEADTSTGLPPSIAGSQSQTASGDEISGFAAAECGTASGDVWLAGGSTRTGRSTLILLSNPSEVAASVDLAVFGETGAVAAVGADGVIIEPRSQRVLPLAALAPEIKSPVVHVSSQGGKVYASLQHSVVRGLMPGGVEMVGPTAAPGVRQVIPGVTLGTPSSRVPNDAGLVRSDAEPTVRIFAAGVDAAQVQVSVMSEDGVGGDGGVVSEAATEPTATFTTVVPGNTAVDVPLEGVPPGAYTVIVSSQTPVVTSVRGATSGSSDLDFAWFVAAQPVTGPFVVSVAKGPAPQLHLYNEGQSACEITIDAVAGVTGNAKSSRHRTIVIEPGAARVVPLVAGARYETSGAVSLAAAVSFTGNGLASSFAVSPAHPLATPLTVYRG